MYRNIIYGRFAKFLSDPLCHSPVTPTVAALFSGGGDVRMPQRLVSYFQGSNTVGNIFYSPNLPAD
jgi:hypothetical protein